MYSLHMLGGIGLSDAEARQIDAVLRKPKHLALLAYLAMPCPGKWHRRDSILGIFWPDLDQLKARTSLRSALHTLRRELEDGTIQTRGDDEIAINCDLMTTDVARMSAELSSGQYENALAEYGGDFLPGLHISGAEEFERWLSAERARLLAEARKAANMLAQMRENAGDLAGAIAAARRSAELDPHDEVAARKWIALLDRAGDRSQAFAVYEKFRNHVSEHFGVRPSAETVALVDSIRTRHKAAVATSADEIAPAIAPTGTRAPAPRTGSDFSATASSPATRAGARRVAIVSGAVAAALMVVFWLVTRDRGPVQVSPASANSIAVLAFENATSDSAVDYFSYGLTDGLIDQLASSGNLRVTQGPSAFVVRGRRTDTRALAESLGVANLLASGVFIDGDDMHVSVKLINAHDGLVRWSRTYRGKWASRFVVQDSIESQVPRELAKRLPGARNLLAARFPRTHRAYELYLMGRHQWNDPRLQPSAQVRRAIEYFRNAIKEDSSYAEAYAGLAASYTVLGTGNFSDFSPQLASDSARAAALKALALNDSVPEAHVALAFVHMLYDFDWDASERELNKARELNPYYARSPLWPSGFYAFKGDFPTAVAEAARSVETDPLSSAAVIDYARALLFAGRVADAKAQIRRAVAIDSTGDRYHLTAGEIALSEKQYPLAMKEFGKFADFSRQSSRALAFMAHTEAAMGDRRAADSTLSVLLARHRAGKTTAFDLAIVYAGMHDYDDGFLWLNRAYDDKSIRPLMMGPTFAAMRRDARFDMLLRRMKLRG